MQLRSLLLHIVVMIMIALSGWPQSFAATQTADIPPWLQAHVGTGEDHIAPVVLQRGRALYQQRVSEGAIKNPCYFAMDATRPSTSPGDGLGRRFYIICEADRLFRAISSGYGSGRNLRGLADFANGMQCAKHFSSAVVQADDGRRLRDGRHENVVQRVLSRRGQDDAFSTLVLAV